MAKIVSNFFTSLDGVVEAPDQWHFPYFNDEMGAAIDKGTDTSTAFLMGRVLYDEWAAYWPNQGDRIRELEQETDGDIVMFGSATLVRWLLANRLLDELNLMVHPIAVGHGQHLFEDTPTHPLKLVKHETFETGVLNLTYAPAEE